MCDGKGAHGCVSVLASEERIVYAYRSPTYVREFTETGTLMGDEVLKGFSVPVSSLFEI